MKKHVLSLAVALLSGFTAFSQNTSNLEIFSENGEKFILKVNGEQKNETPQTNVKVTGLSGDFFQLSIDFEEDALGILNQNIMLEPGKEQRAVVMLKKNGKYAVRPFGEPVAIASAPAEPNRPSPPPPAPAPAATPSKPAPSTTTTVTTTTTTSGPATVGESVDMKIGVGGEEIGISVKVNDAGFEQSTTVTESTTTTAVAEFEEPMESDEVVIVDDCAPMAGGDFQSALNSIKSKSFSDSRMTQAKQVLKGNCLSAEQVKSMMSVFDYEEDKLAFAKAAYDRCSDPENYWKVNDAFTFEMTIDELNEYIESK